MQLLGSHICRGRTWFLLHHRRRGQKVGSAEAGEPADRGGKELERARKLWQ